MKRRCEERLRSLVAPDEEILAKGTVDEMRRVQSNLSSGGAWTFALLTGNRLLFARWASPQEEHEQIVLDEVSKWVEATQYHRCAIALTHPPMKRMQHVTAHNILWFHWGNARAEVTRSETIFRFSRRDTEVATALRAELQRREVPTADLHLDETPRSQRHGKGSLKRRRWYRRTPRWARR